MNSSEHITTDVAVVGVGAMGSTTLWQLAERGVPAVGFERFEPGHDRGSSHGQSRIYRTAYLEGAGYVPLAQRALVLWRELQRQSGDSLIVENGSLTIGPRESTVIMGTMASIRAHGLPHRLLDPEEVRRLYPPHVIGDDEVAIREDDAGLVRPEKAVVAAARRAEQLGARIMRHTVVDAIEPAGSGVRVTAGDVTCEARHVVVTSGAWLGAVLPELGFPLRVTRQVLAWFPIERPEHFAPDVFPVFLRDMGVDGVPGDVTTDATFYGFPTLDGGTIKAAIHQEGKPADPDNLDRTVTADDLDPIRDLVDRYLQGVSTEVVQSQVCMYTNTPDHDFLLGSPPSMPWLTVLGGFSGHGFKFATVMGEIGADLATKGETSHPIGFLSVDRFLESGVSSSSS